MLEILPGHLVHFLHDAYGRRREMFDHNNVNNNVIRCTGAAFVLAVPKTGWVFVLAHVGLVWVHHIDIYSL